MIRPVFARFTGLCLSIGLCMAGAAQAAQPAAADVIAALDRSVNWQLANPSGIDTRDWVIAPLYDGLVNAALATGKANYLAPVIQLGTQSGWMPADRIYHADDHAVGHAWLDIYMMGKHRSERLRPMRDRMDYIIAHPVTEFFSFTQPPKTPGVLLADRWTWADALYMAPPTLARLYTATGDKKYLNFMDKEFKSTADHLYDPVEHLFFRDASYFERRTTHGQKTFWSRGNGWVYAGLTQIITQLPTKHPSRAYYVALFKEMTGAILAAQQADGLWRPSMKDPDEVTVGETSGSGFFVYGLAWGINHGILERAKVWPAITRGWEGLTTRVKPDGYVGYVQPISAGPKAIDTYIKPTPDGKPAAAKAGRTIDENSKQDYGTGAFLLAGSEVLRAIGAAAKTPPAVLLAKAEALVAAEAKTPRAYARMVPERADDLAWENDKVAFRTYGPALRAGAEDSGIDVWFKKVPYPIINKWYAQDLGKQKITYHKDHGEGYDGYHVGDTRGCGGLGLWVDGKLVTSDTYIGSAIHWTAPEVAEFTTVYQYPLSIGGKPLFEQRRTRLRRGERFMDIKSFFSTDPEGNDFLKQLPYEIVIGVVTQDDANATIHFKPEEGILAVTETVDGKALGTGVIIDPKQITRTAKLDATDKEKKNAHGLIYTHLDDGSYVRYRAGFAWSGDGDITTLEQWLKFLAQQAAKQP